MRCSKCGSSDVVSKESNLKDSTHTALHVGGHQLHPAMAGHPGGLAVVAGLWAANKVVKFFTDTFKCNNCGREFTR